MDEKIQEKINEVILSVFPEAKNISFSLVDGCTVCEFDNGIFTLYQLRKMFKTILKSLDIEITNYSFFVSLDDSSLVNLSFVFV